MRRFDFRVTLVARAHRVIGHASGEQGPFQRSRRNSVQDRCFDLANQKGEVVVRLPVLEMKQAGVDLAVTARREAEGFDHAIEQDHRCLAARRCSRREMRPARAWPQPDRPRTVPSMVASAASSNSRLNRPACAASQTAAPSSVWIDFTPVSPPARRSTMRLERFQRVIAVGLDRAVADNQRLSQSLDAKRVLERRLSPGNRQG